MAPTPDSNRHRSPAIADAVKHDRLDELDGLLTGWAVRPEQRVRIALQSRVEATRRHVLAGCERSASFHAGAVAVALDDPAAIREAHRVGEDWHAMLGPPLDWTAVQLAAALGHVASLRALIALGVEIDHATSQGHDRTLPLVLAMRHGQWEAAQVLVEAGSDPNLSDLIEFLPDAPRALLAALLAHGLRWEFVQGNAGLMATTLTPASLGVMVELGLRVDQLALAWILCCLGVDTRPDAEYVALTRALLRLCPPPPGGVVTDPDGERLDILARALERLPLQVARDLVAAGVTLRKVRVPGSAPEAAEKKAWLKLPAPPREGEPALAFADFLGLADEDLTEARLTAQLTLGADQAPRLGPLRLGMRAADIEPIAASKWQPDGDRRWSVGSDSGRNFREHRIELEMLADGRIFHIQYRLLYNSLAGDDSPPILGAYLTDLLGKPSKKIKQVMTWLRGETRTSLAFQSGADDRFGDQIVLEIVDERHKDQAQRHAKFWKF